MILSTINCNFRYLTKIFLEKVYIFTLDLCIIVVKIVKKEEKRYEKGAGKL